MIRGTDENSCQTVEKNRRQQQTTITTTTLLDHGYLGKERSGGINCIIPSDDEGENSGGNGGNKQYDETVHCCFKDDETTRAARIS